MKRSEAKQVGEIFNEMINATGQRDAYDRQRLCYIWPEVVGPTINRCTIKRYVENRVLHVYLTSAPLKSELGFLREQLVKRLNEAAGVNVIDNIVIH